jgi:putative ABC transport system permease protein
MKWGRISRDAWQALLKHKLRSILSILGIVFAIIAVVAMLAIAEGAKQETLELIESLGTNNIIIRQIDLTAAQRLAAQERHSRGLELSDIVSLKRTIPNLGKIAALKEVQAAVSASTKKDPFEILAVTADYQQVNNLGIHQGRFICTTDVSRSNLVCVIGAELRGMLGDDGRLGKVVRLEDRSYRVVGILQERQKLRSNSSALTVRNYNRVIFIPLGTEPVAAHNQDSFGDLSEIWLRVSRKSNVNACALAVRSILTRKHGNIEDFQIIVPQELLNQAKKIQSVFNIVLGCIAGISLLVGGIGIMNTMLASVAERTREIGIRRSVGATRMHIVVHFLCESIVLTILGGCVGIVLGAGSAIVISKAAGWKTVVTLWSMLISIGMAGSVGLVSGLYPAIKASRLDPVTALRQE